MQPSGASSALSSLFEHLCDANAVTHNPVDGAVTADGIYKMVKHYAKRVGVNIEGFGAHLLRATAATNALDHEADIAKV
jgi:site-specific recombinase XerD